jgi:hypothetical protein
MKQLSIYCSRDLEDRVIAALDRVGVEGFMRVGGATGNKFKPPAELPRAMTWEAILFLVPAAPDNKIEQVIGELERYAGACEVRPCLKIVVSTVEKVV